MEWGKLTRKLSVAALGLALTAGTIPGTVFAAGSLQTQLSSKISLTHTTPGTYISPKINIKSTADVRVIVQLSGQPAAVGKYAAKQGNSALAKSSSEAAVASQQSTVLEQAKDEGIDLRVNYKYNTVLNGFEVTVPANEIPELAQIPGVKSIYENSTWYPIPVEEADASIQGTLEHGAAPLDQIGANAAWAKNITGAGLKVGVIDTGVDYKHPDIAPAYKGGWDSFYNDDDPYEEEPNADKKFEGTSHGTHVSGTIIGRYANKTSDIVQKGVAYGADLYVYKVLGYNPANPSSASGSSAQVIDGIERSVKDGMDVINLSLGSDAEKDVNSPDAIAINNAILSGVTAVIANGNAGPGEYTLGSPATSQLAISVGAVTSPTKNFSGKFDVTFDGDSVTTATYATYGEFNVMAWELGSENFADPSLVGTEPLHVIYAGLGADDDYKGYTADEIQDSVVFVSRGLLAFTEKIENAKERGAKAIVIFNGNANADGEVDLSENIKNRNGYINSYLGDTYDSIPTFDMEGAKGRTLARAILANPDTEVTFTFGDDYHEAQSSGDELASFTSWGPNVDQNLSIKPDVVAPGVGVLSTWPAYQKYDAYKNASYDYAYNRISGTSMATPHVAGLALLLQQAHPSWGPFEIRAALANTADVLDEYSVYQQGAGRVNVAKAIDTPAVLESVEPITILDKSFNPQNITNYNSSANFGVVAPGSSKIENLQIKNTDSSSITYTASVKWSGTAPAGIKADLSQTELAVAGYETKPFYLTANVDSGVKSGFYEGQIILTAPNLPALHLPFSVYVGTELPNSPVGIQEISLTHPVIYPKRSTQTTTDLSFKLSADNANLYELDIYNLDDELIGYKDYYDTVNEATYFEPKVYNVKDLDNSYYKYDEEGQPVFDGNHKPVVGYLTDGVYKLNIVYAHITPEGKATDIYNGFISLRVDNSLESSGGGGGGGGAPAPIAPTTPPAPAVSDSATALVDQGYKQVTVASATAVQNGVTTITVSDSDLKAALANATAAQNAVIISAPAVNGSAAKVSLTADQVNLLAGISSSSKVIVSTKDAAVSLPVSLLSGSPAGAAFELSIKPASEQAGKFSASAAGSSVIGAPVSFEASWATATGSTYLTVPNNTFIKRSFTVPGSITPNTAGVLFEENGKITPVASVFKTQADGTTLVTVNRPGFSTYAAVSRPVTFTDIATSPAASDITALANKLIFKGTSATTFSPKNNLTRAEFTAILVRALGLRSDAAATFTDVKATDWYAADVAAATKAGLILGVGGGKFAPKANVSRQEVAVILDRAVKLAGIELTPANPSFTAYSDNAKIAGYAKDSVQFLSAAGILTGTSGSVFNPTAPATRETIAATLHQLLVKAGLAE